MVFKYERATCVAVTRGRPSATCNFFGYPPYNNDTPINISVVVGKRENHINPKVMLARNAEVEDIKL